MGKIKMKLLLSLLAVLLALVLLVSVTLAWYTASTSPEVSAISFNISMYHALLVSMSPDGNWSESISFAAFISDTNLCKILQPVSTMDGIHWFAPTYVDGQMNEVTQFEHSDTLAWGNVSYLASFTDASGTNLTHQDDIRDAAEAQSHFIYADFWVRSEYPDGCVVRLSVPHQTEETELGGYYGTYVMPKYVASGTEIVCNSNGAETAVRIGFQIFGSGTDASPTDFIIYEPNADKRSSAADKETAGEYVKGYEYSPYSYTSDYYIKTSPVAWLPDLVSYPFPTLYAENGGSMELFTGVTLVTDTNYYVSGTDYVSSTDAPSYWEGNQNWQSYVLFEPPTLYMDDRPTLTHVTATSLSTNETYYYSTGYSAKLGEISPDKLIVQKAGTWNLDKVKEKLQLNQSLNSTAIATFGDFINTDEICSNANTAVPINTLTSDIAGNAVLFTLPDDTPIKIRLFVWVEGQDPDCWNDIHTGTFTINIELAGETKY